MVEPVRPSHNFSQNPSSSRLPKPYFIYASNTVDLYGDDLEFDPRHSGLTNRDRNVVGASSAGIRAILYQVSALYLRTPVKLFRPSRFDYLATAKLHSGNQEELRKTPYNFRTHSSFAILSQAVRKNGWRYIPDQVLPPLIANSLTGVVLYTTYLSTLELFTRNQVGPRYQLVYDPADCFRAGFIAGAVQSLVAAPIDAIYARSSAAELLEGKHESMWIYGFRKLKDVGLVGVFAGWGVSFIKESFGFGFYFSTFELIKTQGYSLAYKMIRSYRNLKGRIWYSISGEVPVAESTLSKFRQTKASKLLESTFVLIAGASAAFTLLAVQYPLSKIQKIHLARLEALDIYNAASVNPDKPFIKLYYNAYLDSCVHVVKIKRKSHLNWFRWGYKGFLRNGLWSIPSASVGLLVFEVMRNRLEDEVQGVPLE